MDTNSYIINLDTKIGREAARKETAKSSSKRYINSKELYRFTLDISPTSFQTITDEQKEELKAAIKKEVGGKIKKEIVEE
ncbi:hypothetical protein HZB03_04965 [Candidatus Woesearchaeota archaeon]|nr:hypothetical protein [Candidatus Woesearchaeota archaeon]